MKNGKRVMILKGKISHGIVRLWKHIGKNIKKGETK